MGLQKWQYGTCKISLKLGEKQNKKIDITINDYCPFRMACEGGHLEIVKYLIEIGKDIKHRRRINIHARNEYGFRSASQNGHLELVKYLIELGKDEGKEIDIHREGDYAFRKACENGHLSVAEWLLSFYTNLELYELDCYLADEEMKKRRKK